MRIALDLDGTLVTCCAKQVTLLQVACTAHGVGPSMDELWRLKRAGYSTEHALTAVGIPPDVAAAVARQWYEEVESPFWCQMDALFPDALPSLEHAAERGDSLLLLTARRRPELVQQQIDRLRIRRYFDSIVVVDPRHAAAMKSLALSEWGADVFIGDTESDRRAAENARIPFIGVSTGQRSAEGLGGIDVADTLRSAISLAMRG